VRKRISAVPDGRQAIYFWQIVMSCQLLHTIPESAFGTLQPVLYDVCLKGVIK
jgi:hypothetical protein